MLLILARSVNELVAQLDHTKRRATLSLAILQRSNMESVSGSFVASSCYQQLHNSGALPVSHDDEHIDRIYGACKGHNSS